MTNAPVIFWFRRDLRVSDHPALLEAVRRAHGSVLATFVIDDELLAPAGPTRARYLRRSLEALDASIGGSLVIRRGEPSEVLRELARECGARSVVATADFTPFGRARDARVRDALGEVDIETTYLDSPYVVVPGTVRTQAGSGCLVFGAFARGWSREARPSPLAAPLGVNWWRAPSRSLDELEEAAGTRRPSYFGDLPDAPAVSLPAAGEAAGTAQLEHFRAHLAGYASGRDVPSLDATSRLSPFLRFGALHPRQVLASLDESNPDHHKFIDEVAWREFYADVLFHHPGSARESFQPSMRALRYDDDARAHERFRAWALGRTGYPLVDAGMRQLLEDGWMHNRVRMVCASFLVKHLHLDWRWGARWFMWRLADGDLASNQHGWQWTAGTGTDAAPFHRIFNPTLQAKRFDPEGVYVKRYVAELAATPVPDCLEPGGGSSLFNAQYVVPLVDADEERRDALARFAEARELARSGS